MKKLLLCLFAGFTVMSTYILNAEQEHAVIGCKILLDKGEYTHHNGDLYIKERTIQEVFESVKMWEILEFKVFIYVQCPNCGQAHLADHACNSEMCKNRVR
jgi:hypothetical protein